MEDAFNAHSTDQSVNVVYGYTHVKHTNTLRGSWTFSVQAGEIHFHHRALGYSFHYRLQTTSL